MGASDFSGGSRCFPLLWGLQIIVGGVASTPEEVKLYASCTLLAASLAAEGAGGDSAANGKERSQGAIEACIEWLMENEFIHIQKDKDGEINRHHV